MVTSLEFTLMDTSFPGLGLRTLYISASLGSVHLLHFLMLFIADEWYFLESAILCHLQIPNTQLKIEILISNVMILGCRAFRGDWVIKMESS